MGYKNCGTPNFYKARETSVKVVMKSQLIEKALADNPKLSHVRAEDVAKSSEEYVRHLKGTSVAIGVELKAKAKYNKLSNQFEAYRSLISLDKKLEGKSGSESEQLEYQPEEEE